MLYFYREAILNCRVFRHELSRQFPTFLAANNSKLDNCELVLSLVHDSSNSGQFHIPAMVEFPQTHSQTESPESESRDTGLLFPSPGRREMALPCPYVVYDLRPTPIFYKSHLALAAANQQNILHILPSPKIDEQPAIRVL